MTLRSVYRSSLTLLYLTLVYIHITHAFTARFLACIIRDAARYTQPVLSPATIKAAGITTSGDCSANLPTRQTDYTEEKMLLSYHSKIIFMKRNFDGATYAWKFASAGAGRKEMKMLQRLAHVKSPWLTRLCHFFKSMSVDSNELVLILQRMPNSNNLKDVVENKGAPLAEEEIRPLVEQLVEALRDMRKVKVSHLDLKPANVIWNRAHKKLMIIDFDMSEVIEDDEIIKISAGTPAYAAPEIYDVRVTWATDLWGIGAILFWALNAKTQFQHRVPHDYKPKQLIFPNTKLTEEAKDFVRRLMETKPKKRLGYKNLDEILVKLACVKQFYATS